MKKIVLGLSGVKQSGKTTATLMIREFINAKEVALADHLKKTIHKVFEIPKYYMHDQEFKEKQLERPLILDKKSIRSILKSFNLPANLETIDKKLIDTQLNTPRQALTLIGTELLRTAGGENVHCKTLKFDDSHSVYVVSDVRFPNEFNYLSALEGISFIPLFIHRTEAEKQLNKKSHSSEASVLKFKEKCIQVDNNGDLRNLEHQIKGIVDTYIFNVAQK